MPKAKARVIEAGTVLTPQEIVNNLREAHGEGAAKAGGLPTARGYISTQCATLDYALGRNGIPTAGITNIFGEESSGKSTVSYHLLAETQRRGGIAILIDSEGAYDYDRGRRIGINYEELIRLEPITLQESFDVIEDAILQIKASDPNRLACVVFDSIAGQTTKAAMEGSYSDIIPADRARVVSQALPKLNQTVLLGSNVALVLVNQLRAKIEMGPSWGGPKMTQTAEGSLRFWSAVRIHFRAASAPIRAGTKEDSDAIGIKVTGKIVKNKVAPNFKNAEFEIRFWDGIDKDGAKLGLALKVGIVTMGGGWYVFGERKFRAKEWPEILKANPDIDKMLEAAPLLWMEEG